MILKRKPTLDPNTAEFWESLEQGNLVELIIIATHHRTGDPGHERKCAIITSVCSLSPLIYDARVSRGNIHIWVKLNGQRWRYRFLPTNSSSKFTQRFENRIKEPKDTKVTITFDGRWPIIDRKYRPAPELAISQA